MYTASFSASVKGQCCHQSTADEVWLQSFSFYMYNWCDVCMCVFSMDSLAQMRRSYIYEISSLCGFVLSLHYVPQDTFHSSKYWDIWLWRQWSCLLFLTWYPFWKAIYKNKYILAWWLILHCSLEYLMEILCTSERLQRKKKRSLIINQLLYGLLAKSYKQHEITFTAALFYIVYVLL